MPIDGRKRSLILFASLLLSFSSGVEAGVLGSLCSKGLDTHPRIKSSILKMKSKDYLYDQGIDRYKPQLTITAEGGYEKYKYEYEVGDKWTSNHYYDYGITIICFRQFSWRSRCVRKINAIRHSCRMSPCSISVFTFKKFI